MKLFSTETFGVLERSLNYASLKQKAISSNIANVDTPDYKAKDVKFKDVLNQSAADFKANRTDRRHLDFKGGHPSGQLSIHQRQGTMYNHNGNNVDIDHEMAEMAKNQIYYNALTDRINGKFNSLQTVIKGGR
ncbi:flagellar basal body rod protein FlgB [Bacillus marinisedimentorum]|uniref:flagellar basal body rod protein FlgB n=1 Tax=Bacillus marinisedimentorum TaxID=1821260 RepID=UPI0007DE9637|nr:flagellar basal body rod protein FlgB [Bacillus marinisedimentorum]